MSDERQGTGEEAHTIRQIPKFREVVIDAVYEGHGVPKVHGIMQIEVTGIRGRMAEIRKRGDIPPSMTAYVSYCVARAVASNPAVHAMRYKRRLVMFDDVDVATTVERRVDANTTVPASLVLRSANKMTLREIYNEIREAQKVEFDGISLGDDNKSKRTSMLAALPWLLRRPVWWKMRRDALFRKRTMGTVNVTAVGMFAQTGLRGWGIPVGAWPLTVTVGTLQEMFVPDKEGNPRIAEFLNVAMTGDHTSIDGAPTARFASQLRKHLASGKGLDPYFEDDQDTAS